MVELLVELLAFLRERRDQIVRSVTVMRPRWDPTYGDQGPVETDIDVVDFDNLLAEMDAFGEELRAREKANG